MNFLTPWLAELRLHQWSKNLLLILPLLAAHQIPDLEDLYRLLCALFSFSIAASAIYVFNDLSDLEADRVHPRKRERPFACGALPLWHGRIAVPLLLVLALLVARSLGNPFLIALGAYVLLAASYSLWLKALLLVDCFVLAMLYTIRVVAGAVLFSHVISFWLLAFSFFLFLSLAYVKRYAELLELADAGAPQAQGRGYHTGDLSLVQSIGVVSGFASVLVLAFYLNSDAVRPLYRVPEVGWAGVLVLLFWVNWTWLQAHRRRMHDDPLVFALSDPVSLGAGAVFALIMLGSTLGWPLELPVP